MSLCVWWSAKWFMKKELKLSNALWWLKSSGTLKEPYIGKRWAVWTIVLTLMTWRVGTPLWSYSTFFCSCTYFIHEQLLGFIGFHSFAGFCTSSPQEVFGKKDIGFQISRFPGFHRFLGVAWVEKLLETKMLNYWCIKVTTINNNHCRYLATAFPVVLQGSSYVNVLYALQGARASSRGKREGAPRAPKRGLEGRAREERERPRRRSEVRKGCRVRKR
jgi:hypothetical protein